MQFAQGIPDYIFQEGANESFTPDISNIPPTREPDEFYGDEYAAWFDNPENPQHALEVERHFGDDYLVTQYTYANPYLNEYQDDKEPIYIKVSTYVSADDIVQKYSVSEDELSGVKGLQLAAKLGEEFIAEGKCAENGLVRDIPHV